MASRSRSFCLYFLSPHPFPFLSQPVHGERKAFRAVTNGLLATAAPLPGLMHFLVQHVQGHVAAQCHFCQLPILQEKRDLVTGPIQADDMQRFVAHIDFTRAATGRIFILRPSFAVTFPQTRDGTSITVSSFFRNSCKARTAHFLRTSAEKRASTDVSIEEGAERLTDPHRRPILLNREEKELAMRPVLPWHIPLHGGCAQTHTIHRIQIGPNALPDRLFPQTLEEANARHCETPFRQALGPRPLIQIFHTSGLRPAQQLDL